MLILFHLKRKQKNKIDFTTVNKINVANNGVGEIDDANKSNKKSLNINAKMDSIMVYIFTKITMASAKNPVKMLLLMITLAIILCIGMTRLKLTVDPIELWASPTSRSRIEKDFFESNFRPFYRTEQVIIKALGDPFNYTDLFGQNVTFGPVFKKEFLLALLELQQDIEKIKTPDGGITLQDVSTKLGCFVCLIF